jgi:hypothetical protein
VSEHLGIAVLLIDSLNTIGIELDTEEKVEEEKKEEENEEEKDLEEEEEKPEEEELKWACPACTF